MQTLPPISQLVKDLAPFADLGSGPPMSTKVGNDDVIRLFRNGKSRDLTLLPNGTILECLEDSSRLHVSLRALFASDDWANLRQWAKNQTYILTDEIPTAPIPINGRQDEKFEGTVVELIENFFESNGSPLSLILLDGPAGIGKTMALKTLALSRAQNFVQTQKPLVLHLESRGKILQNIDDLIALNLQSIRTSVTFDQIPILIRHGLILFAIDGFDELGDPNGYELAWAQLNDFIKSVLGSADIILAGRETFVTSESMLRALPVVLKSHTVTSLEVLPVKATEARTWLKSKGWTEDTLGLEQVKSLLSPQSYALRPFFLVQLGKEEVPSMVASGELDDLLTFVMEALSIRETTKFGDNVDRVLSVETRTIFIRRLMIEVARDMAENQTDSISATNLAWLCDFVTEGMPEEVRGILRNRANVIAYLTQDANKGRLRFIHENAYYYWLSTATLDSLSQNETPKFIRRNIFNLNFLEILSDQARFLEPSTVFGIVSFAEGVVKDMPENDRIRRNCLAVSLAILSTCPLDRIPLFKDVFLEEAFITETISAVELKSVIISQLSAQRCNFQALDFDDSSRVITLIVDNGSLPPPGMMAPTRLLLNNSEITNPEEIESWIRRSALNEIDLKTLNSDITQTLSEFPLFALLQKIVRFRRYWIKDDETDRVARRILDDSNWPTLNELLFRHGLLSVSDKVGTSGRPAKFYHMRNRDAFFDLSKPPKEVHAFLLDLLGASL